jgi:methylenetetrahydrofolate reductase (NADPH)
LYDGGTTEHFSGEGRLESLLKSGKFVITCELGPPQGASPEPLVRKAVAVRDYVDGANLTDCTSAMVRMSSLASSLIVMRAGIEPIMQITLRDRNRIGLQSDILGASALGIRNVLCLYGDPPSAGNEKDAKPVYDIPTEALIGMLRKMRDESLLLGGGKLTVPPKLFIGAAASPSREESQLRIERIRKKVDAGAQFIQTQPVFDTELFEDFMKDMNSSGIADRAAIIAGLMPIRSVKMAKHLREQVHGISVTDEIVERMERSSSPEETGIKIAVETIERLRKLHGLRGVHIMTVSWEQIIPELIERAGLPVRREVTGQID